MKKSLVAAAAIVILGAAWTGASWYTGKLAEQHVVKLTESANKEIKQRLPDAAIKLVVQDHQRGVFSSEARFVLRTDAGSADSETSPNPDDGITVTATISHGPFPLTQLKKFHFSPSMASVHSMFADTPAAKKLFEITKGQSLLQADSRISYNGDTSSDIVIMPFDYQNDSLTIESSGSTLRADISGNGSEVVLEGRSDTLGVSCKNKQDKLEQLTVKGITLTGHNKSGKFDIRIGDNQLDIEQLIINIDGHGATTLSGFHLKSHLDENEHHFNGGLGYTLDALNIHGSDFGSGQLAVNFEKLDGMAVKQFIDVYNQKMLQQRKNSDFDAWKTEVNALLAAKLPAFLQANPTFSIAPLSWKNEKGESTFTLSVALTNPAPATTPARERDTPLIQAVKNLDMQLTIPMAMATELTIHMARLQGNSDEESQKLAQQQVQGLAALGQMFRLTTTKDEAISSTVHYADNSAEVNGQKLSVEEFIDLFSVFGTSLPAMPSAQ